MKKLFLFFTVLLYQTNHGCYTNHNYCFTPRIKRQCHLRYTDEHFRNDLGNRYLAEALEETRKKRYLTQSEASQKNQQSRSKSLQPTSKTVRGSMPDRNMNSMLIIQSILPALHYPPKISSFEILPKR